MEVCVFCSIVVAPFDPNRRKIKDTNIVCHSHCQDAAIRAAEEKQNGK